MFTHHLDFYKHRLNDVLTASEAWPLPKPSILSKHVQCKVLRKNLVRAYANMMKSGTSAMASRHLWSKMSNIRTPVEKLQAIAARLTFAEVFVI